MVSVHNRSNNIIVEHSGMTDWSSNKRAWLMAIHWKFVVSGEDR
jgi:hypothetical protein